MKDQANIEIPMRPVKSSAVTQYGYDAPSRTLAIRFKNGKTYRYEGVPADVAEELAKVKSFGQFVTQRIVGKFKTSKP